MILPGPSVSAQWVVENLDRIRLADVRWSIPTGPKRDDYLDGHLPGAVFVDLDRDLSDPPGERGRHPLPSAQRFALARARLGFDQRPVVAYDDSSGSVAARLWWMLDAIGLPAAVLDGGIAAWDGPLESGWVDPVPSPIEPVPWPADRFVDIDDVADLVAGGAVLLDARSAERFRGEPNPIDTRPGHVPGARSRPWTDNLGDDGRLQSPDRLAGDLDRLGAVPGADLVANCGSGVTGCHLLWAAAVAGRPPGRLYTGSWSEWSADPDRPVATGDED